MRRRSTVDAVMRVMRETESAVGTTTTMPDATTIDRGRGDACDARDGERGGDDDDDAGGDDARTITIGARVDASRVRCARGRGAGDARAERKKRGDRTAVRTAENHEGWGDGGEEYRVQGPHGKLGRQPGETGEREHERRRRGWDDDGDGVGEIYFLARGVRAWRRG